MQKEKLNSAASVLRIYFRAAFMVMLLTLTGAGIILAENGTRRVEGTEPDIAVLSQRENRVELLFPKKTLQFRLPGYTPLTALLPPPLGNAIWFARAIIEVAGS